MSSLITELVLQKPQECRFALETPQARGIEAELEYPPLAGRVTCQPDFAEPAFAKLVENIHSSRPGQLRPNAGRQPSVASSPGLSARRPPFVSGGGFRNECTGTADLEYLYRPLCIPSKR